MEFRGSREVVRAKEESPLRKALREQFRELFNEQGITFTEREKALDKLETDVRRKGTEHLYLKQEAGKKEGGARPAVPGARERELQEHKKGFELSRRAAEAFSKLPEENGGESGGAMLKPSAEREFAAWVTKKMNAGEPLPDDAAERLRQYEAEKRQEETAA